MQILAPPRPPPEQTPKNIRFWDRLDYCFGFGTQDLVRYFAVGGSVFMILVGWVYF